MWDWLFWFLAGGYVASMQQRPVEPPVEDDWDYESHQYDEHEFEED